MCRLEEICARQGFVNHTCGACRETARRQSRRRRELPTRGDSCRRQYAAHGGLPSTRRGTVLSNTSLTLRSSRPTRVPSRPREIASPIGSVRHLLWAGASAGALFLAAFGVWAACAPLESAAAAHGQVEVQS